jgi:hypothetical protein
MIALRRRAVAIGLMSAALIVHLVLYLLTADETGRGGSTAFRVLAFGVMFVCVVVMVGVVALFRIDQDRLTRIRHLMARLHAPFVSAAALTVFVFAFNMRPEPVYAHITLVLLGSASLAHLVLYGDDTRMLSASTRRVLLVIGVGAVILIMVIRALGLSYAPTPNLTDEPWNMSWAYSFARDGVLSEPLMYYGGGDLGLEVVPHALWMRVTGGFDWWASRLYYLLLSLPFIALTALAACNLYGRTMGWVTVLVLFGMSILASSARVRHDLPFAIMVALSLYLYSGALRRETETERALFWHAAAGIAIAFGWFAHYHAIGFGVALAVALYAPRQIARWRSGHRALDSGLTAFVLGGVIGAGLVFVIQIVPQWEGFLAKRQPRSSLALIDEVLPAFVGYLRAIWEHSLVEFVLVAFAFITLWMRRTAIDMSIALGLVCAHLAITFMATLEPWKHYIIPILPFYAIAIAAFIVRSWIPQSADAFTAQPRRRAALIAAALLALSGLGVIVRPSLQVVTESLPVRLPAPASVAWLRNNLQNDQPVVLPHWYYLWMPDYHVVSALTYDYLSAALRAQYPTDAELWDSIQPDYVVNDRNLSDCCVPQPIYDPQYLAARGYTIAAEFPGDRVPIVIYHRDNAED